MQILDAVLQTASGERVKATWFNQPWVEKNLREGAKLILTGRVKRFGKSAQLGVEHMELLDSGGAVAVRAAASAPGGSWASTTARRASARIF